MHSRVVIVDGLGRIEGRYHYTKRNAPIALVLGGKNDEHDFSGLLSDIYFAFSSLGFNTLHFEFRKPEKESVEISNLKDAITCWSWMQSNNPYPQNAWISGASLGGWVAMQLLMRRPEIQYFVTMSMPAEKQDFSFLNPCPTNGLMLHGANSDVIPATAVQNLVNNMSMQAGKVVDYTVVSGADHKFAGKKTEVIRIISDYIKRMNTTIAHEAA